MERDVLLLTIGEQTSFGKHDVGIPRRTPVGDAVPHVHDDVFVRAHREHMIALAVAALRTFRI